MRRGEVWRARLVGSGHAQAGERPVVIVQNNPAISQLSTVLIVPFTSNLKAQRYPGTVLVQPDQFNGLTLPSIALAFQTVVHDKRALLEKLGELEDETLKLIVGQIVSLVS